MSEREAFEKLQKSIPPWIVFDDANGSYRLAEQALNSNARHELINSYNREWWIFQAAVEHCKQGEPVASIIFNEDEEYTCMPIGREVFKLAPNVEHMLFTHAMPKSDGRCTSCNGNDSDAPCAYPSENKHGCLRDERIATPQPSTDVSELVKALQMMISADNFCSEPTVNDEHKQAKADAHEEAYSNAKALIAKHTVK